MIIEPQPTKKKDKYKISNWKQYNESLKSRGDITIWIGNDIAKQWAYEGVQERGGKKIYTELAIKTCLIVRKVYHLPLRQTEGFISSLMKGMGINCQIPHYSTLSRRSGELNIPLRDRKNKEGIHVVLDSSGLKVYGEGEWKVRKHGWSKHRTWRKLHVGIDRETQEIVMEQLTDNTVDDAQAAKKMIEHTPIKIKSMTGDGAYDKSKLRKALHKKEITPIIPPRRDALISNGTKEELKSRDDDIKRIAEIGRTAWKQEVHYHKRSRVEVTMFRYKTIIGDKLTSRTYENQQSEVRIGCCILNKMTQLGMPISRKVV